MQPSRLAVLGAGHVGPVIARLAIKAGYPVAIATSGDPESLALITELMIPGAQPRWARDAVAEADIVARPAGAPDRRAAAVAGDDHAAVATIARLVDGIGYDPVRLESLRAGRAIEPGGPVFGAVLPLDEFERAVRVGARSLA